VSRTVGIAAAVVGAGVGTGVGTGVGATVAVGDAVGDGVTDSDAVDVGTAVAGAGAPDEDGEAAARGDVDVNGAIVCDGAAAGLEHAQAKARAVASACRRTRMSIKRTTKAFGTMPQINRKLDRHV
jgi:hypothetical protein